MIVLDASAAVHILRETPEGSALSGLMLDGEEVISCSLYHSEMANSLWKYVRAGIMSEELAVAYYENSWTLVDEFEDVEDYLVEALHEAVRLQHPVYDMLYFVLARRTGATLFTVDRKLQNLCLDNGVECIYSTVLPE